VINEFVARLEKEYQNDTSKYEQIIFEYNKSYNDDEDCTSISFSETPFHTNKSFDNIFFEDKFEFIKFLKPFIKSTRKTLDMTKYEQYGIPFKGICMLHGPPGCGKSSLIKSTIKHTGRHCVLVPWSKLKTCSEFVALFRPLKIGNRVYEQSELVIVFEDFDANNSEILKTRENLKTATKTNAKPIIEFSEEKLKKICEDNFLVPMASSANSDDLNLEYILNVLEGIVELHDSLVFFTTNDLKAIDPALKRVGRMDKTIKMDYITKSVLEEMLCYYYNMKSLQKYNKKIVSVVKSNTCYANIVHSISKSETIDDFFKVV
jgi:SpoVK/Ycf46/Vps4 family AAA+-type ATPase